MRTAQSDLPDDLIKFVNFEELLHVKKLSFYDLAIKKDQDAIFLFESYEKISKEIEDLKKWRDDFKLFLKTLSSRDRGIIYYFYYWNRSIKNLAKRYDVTIDTVLKVLARTREKYKKFKTREKNCDKKDTFQKTS